MTIPFIPSSDPGLGASLSSIAQTIGNLARPELMFQLNLRNALAQNPALIQQLGNLAARSPGALGQVYGNEVAQYFQGVGQSPEDAASAKAATFQGSVLDRQNQALKDIPEPVQRAQAEAGVEAALSGGQPRSQVTAEKNTQAVQGAFDQYLNTHRSPDGTFDIPAFIRGVRGINPDGTRGNATVSGDVFAGALQSPYGNAIKALFESQLGEERAASEERMAGARTARDYFNAVNMSRMTQAEAFQRQYRIGTVDSWNKVLYQPPTNEQLNAIRAKPEADRTPAERDLLATQDFYQTIPEQDRQARSRQYLTEFRSGLLAVRNITKNTNAEERESQLTAIASQLNEAAQNAGLNVSVSIIPYKDRVGPFNRQASLKFISNGQEVTEEQLNASLDAAGSGQRVGQTGTSINEQNVTQAVAAFRAGQLTREQITSANIPAADKAEILKRIGTGTTGSR